MPCATPVILVSQLTFSTAQNCADPIGASVNLSPLRSFRPSRVKVGFCEQNRNPRSVDQGRVTALPLSRSRSNRTPSRSRARRSIEDNLRRAREGDRRTEDHEIIVGHRQRPACRGGRGLAPPLQRGRVTQPPRGWTCTDQFSPISSKAAASTQASVRTVFQKVQRGR